MSAAAPPRYFSTAEAALEIRVPESVLRKAIRLGRLPTPARVGRYFVLDWEDVERARKLLADKGGER